jgi:hypothetical protein
MKVGWVGIVEGRNVSRTTNLGGAKYFDGVQLTGNEAERETRKLLESKGEKEREEGLKRVLAVSCWHYSCSQAPRKTEISTGTGTEPDDGKVPPHIIILSSSHQLSPSFGRQSFLGSRSTIIVFRSDSSVTVNPITRLPIHPQTCPSCARPRTPQRKYVPKRSQRFESDSKGFSY